MKQKTLIIDNDHSTCKKLAYMMKTQMPGIELIGSFTNVDEGMQRVETDKPKLVFVNMHDLTAENFIHLQQIAKTDFTVIFITGDTIDSQINNVPKSILNAQPKKLVRFKFKEANKTHEYTDSEIIRIEAQSNYTAVFLTDRTKPVILARTLKYFCNKLKDSNFIRPHQTHLVNKQFVQSYKNKQLVLNDETVIPVSRRKQRQVKAMF